MALMVFECLDLSQVVRSFKLEWRIVSNSALRLQTLPLLTRARLFEHAQRDLRRVACNSSRLPAFSGISAHLVGIDG